MRLAPLLCAAATTWACSDAAPPRAATADAASTRADARAAAEADAGDPAALDAALADLDAAPAIDGAADPRDGAAGPIDAATSTAPPPQPVLLVHGINGSSADFAVMVERLVQDGLPRDWVRAITFPDPRWGCNVDNASIVRDEVARLRAQTGARRVDLVAHSMGVVSTRYYLKHLGGLDAIATYVTLGGMHHGQRSACLNPLPVCVWQEICPSHEVLTDLNTPPATPGPVRWVSIYSLTDDTISPESAHLEGAENIEFTGVDHSGATGLTEDPQVYAAVRRVLAYPSP